MSCFTTTNFWTIAGPFLLIIQTIAVNSILRHIAIQYGQFGFSKLPLMFIVESLKMFLSFLLFIFQSGSSEGLRQRIPQLSLTSSTALRSTLPAVTSCLHQLFLLKAIDNLSVTMLQTINHLKIIATVVFLQILFNRRYSRFQWTMIVQFCVGLWFVQFSLKQCKLQYPKDENRVLGFVTAVASFVFFGFSNAYTEQLLKNGEAIDIWARTFHISVYGAAFSGFALLSHKLEATTNKDFGREYQAFVWVLVIGQATGGLLTMAVLATHDNIIRSFSNGISFIGSTIIAMFVLRIAHDASFLICGSILVFSSIVGFRYGDGIVRRLRTHGRIRRDRSSEGVVEIPLLPRECQIDPEGN